MASCGLVTSTKFEPRKARGLSLSCLGGISALGSACCAWAFPACGKALGASLPKHPLRDAAANPTPNMVSVNRRFMPFLNRDTRGHAAAARFAMYADENTPAASPSFSGPLQFTRWILFAPSWAGRCVRNPVFDQPPEGATPWTRRSPIREWEYWAN